MVVSCFLKSYHLFIETLSSVKIWLTHTHIPPATAERSRVYGDDYHYIPCCVSFLSIFIHGVTIAKTRDLFYIVLCDVTSETHINCWMSSTLSVRLRLRMRKGLYNSLVLSVSTLNEFIYHIIIYIYCWNNQQAGEFNSKWSSYPIHVPIKKHQKKPTRRRGNRIAAPEECSSHVCTMIYNLD